jgi:hypothetical protein
MKIEKLFLNFFIEPATLKFRTKKYKILDEFLICYSRIKYKINTDKQLEYKGKTHKIFAKV